MADETKNVPIIKEMEQEFKQYKPSDKEQEVVKAVYQKFRFAKDRRNRSFQYFDGDNLLDYINDSVRRATTNIDEREDMEDWQARVHTQFTRNKFEAILGKIVRVLPIGSFKGRGDEDIRKTQILSNLYEYSEELDDYEEFSINFLYEAIVKGTAIGYEGHERKIKKLRDIEKTGDEITVTTKLKQTNKLYAEIVKLEDFYPSSPAIRKIKDMPYCFWVTHIPYQQFLQDYSHYSRSSDVDAYNETQLEDTKPFYADYLDDQVGEGNVQICRYYNQDTDEYIIIANGVWLNPLIGEEISPLPFKHKELPFFECIFERFGPDFFYGKSLPDKLKSIQDVLNVLTNMLLDQSFLTIFPPLITNGFDSIEDDYLRPGRRTPIDTQGLSVQDAFHKVDVGTPTGWHQFILSYMKNMGEEASIDQVSAGQAGGGDRTTAAEIKTAAEGVASTLGLFNRFVNYSIKRKALLRGKNILQFWTDKESPVEAILGEGGKAEFNKVFNTFKMDGVEMTNGKRGSKIIEMFADKQDMPTQKENKIRADIHKAETGKDIEIIAIPAEYIQNIEFDVKVTINPKSEETKDFDKAMQLEKVKVYLSFFPEMVNKKELAAQTAEKMGDDPTKILMDSVFETAPEAAKGQQEQPLSPNPQGNLANNMVRGVQGGNNQLGEGL